MKQKELSRWLRGITAAACIGCIILSAFVVPRLAQEGAEFYPDIAWLKWPGLIGFWIASAILLAALWQAWLVFYEIGRDNSFCAENAARLRCISYLAGVDTGLTLIGTLGFFFMNALHPAILLLLMGIMLFGAAVCVASAALSHLTAKAAELKSDSDLTI